MENITKRIIGVIVILQIALKVAEFEILNIFDKEEGQITFLDYPNDLSSKIETIELEYIEWACACANWLEHV